MLNSYILGVVEEEEEEFPYWSMGLPIFTNNNFYYSFGVPYEYIEE